jgi:putative addiction module killer protein
MIITKIYKTRNGRRPFSKWFSDLTHEQAAKVDEAVYRMERGNLGDHKSVGAGVFERRIFGSPAMRIYYAMDGKNLVILLAGGFKASQSKDILMAKMLWNEYKDRKKNGEKTI